MCPLILKKFLKVGTEEINIILCECWQIFLENFENNFWNFISSEDLSCDHYWKGGIHEIHDFRGFLRIFASFCYFFMKSFFYQDLSKFLWQTSKVWANNQHNGNQIFVKSAILSDPYQVPFSFLLIGEPWNLVSV